MKQLYAISADILDCDPVRVTRYLLDERQQMACRQKTRQSAHASSMTTGLLLLRGRIGQLRNRSG